MLALIYKLIVISPLNGVWQRSWWLGIISPETVMEKGFQETILSYFEPTDDKVETCRLRSHLNAAGTDWRWHWASISRWCLWHPYLSWCDSRPRRKSCDSTAQRSQDLGAWQHQGRTPSARWELETNPAQGAQALETWLSLPSTLYRWNGNVSLQDNVWRPFKFVLLWQPGHGDVYQVCCS